ncbi:D-alanyl-D-alanine carboxypeptidase family protein [Microbacterium sp.]|uniref:D-alanyl-D-alanine carboxypeptidase family protein n=1 Tax=Microbacterium sp. TaxID=51671 RepID=UPI0039E682A4
MLSPRAAPTPHRRRTVITLVACGLALAVVGVVWMLSNQASHSRLSEPAWPTTGTSALSIGTTTVGSPGSDEARPIASLTKLVTALVALDAAPLEPDQSGPSFLLTDADAGYALAEQARDGSSVAVLPGQVLTERQFLEYVLVASSNNHATSLVTHLFGDEQAYLAAARRWLDEHRLSHIQIADASGMSPDNRASARDLITLGRLAAATPAIAELAARPMTISPIGEPLPNTNDLLGTLGITGLKTGHTTEAGYTALFTAPVGGEQLIGVVLGAPSDTQRTTDVTRLIAHVRAQRAG